MGELELPDSVNQQIEQIIVFGSWIVGSGSRVIEVWRAGSYEHYTTLRPMSGLQPEGVLSGRFCTMPTFLNKIFVGRRDGNVEIYNVGTGKLVHTILPPSSTSGSVTALQPTTALCLLAIAYADGSLMISDVEHDEPVMQLRPSHGSHPITTISFRTDGLGTGEDGRQEGVMATASIENGDVTLWDLNGGGRVVGVLRGAHGSGISRLEFLAQQAVLVSSGLDNALRSWIFDQSPFSAIPRPLHSRCGHAAPVIKLRFLPAASDGSEAAGKWLLSAGHDRSLWGFSLRRDGQSSELSQGNIRSKAKKIGHLGKDSVNTEDLKAPPITSIACSLNRDGGMGAIGGPVWANPTITNADHVNMTGWESIVTAHEGDKFARTWLWGKKKAGRWAFETSDHTPVSNVAITACGTFALIGSAGGSLDMFNLQSGLHRQRFPPKLSHAQAMKFKQQQLEAEKWPEYDRGHRDAISGIAVDNLNRTVISCSLDGTVIFWDFMSGKIVGKIRMDSAAATALSYNATSGLVSLVCDDLCIRVLDIETKRIVRELWGCGGQIFDHCFSHDGRWIVACSMDSIVRIFDLATGFLIDAFKTATCTSVAFSSTGEFLATSHAGSIGINLWINKSLFTHISTRQIDEEDGTIDLTASATFSASSQLVVENRPVDENGEGEQIDDTSEMDQLHSSLLTLSLVPQSRWQTLLNLDTIKQRNKPSEPPKQPQKAPFFLPSGLTNGVKSTDDMKDAEAGNKQPVLSAAEKSRVSKLQTLQSHQSPFSTLLVAHIDGASGSSHHDPAPIISHLTFLSPSAADLEIRSLTFDEMSIFVNALSAQLRLNKDFELVNTWMSVFLRLHGDVVQSNEELRLSVLEWRRAMVAEEKRLSELVGYCRGVVEFLRSAR